MKKKVLFIHHGEGIGGAFVSLLNLVQSIDKSKYEIVVFFIKDMRGKEIFESYGIKAYISQNRFFTDKYTYISHFETNFIKWYQLHLQVWAIYSWLVSAYSLAPKIIKSLKPDIVYLNSSVLTDWAFAAKREKYKVIMHIRETFTNGYFGFRKAIIRWLITKYTDYVIAISHYNLRKIGLTKNTSVIYNFINKSAIVPIQGEKIKGKSVLYLGGYSYIKGFITMVNAIQYLDPGINVILAGYYPKDYKNNLKSKIKHLFYPNSEMQRSFQQLNSYNNVEMVGVLDNVGEWLQKVDILISPFSKPHFSRPIIEAFLAKTAIISSDVEGINEIVTDKVNGFLFENNNPKDLAKKINEYFKIENSERNLKLINTAFKYAHANFTNENSVLIEQVIDKVLLTN